MTFQVRDGSRDTSCGIFVLFNDLFLFFCLFYLSSVQGDRDSECVCVVPLQTFGWFGIFAPFLVRFSDTKESDFFGFSKQDDRLPSE